MKQLSRRGWGMVLGVSMAAFGLAASSAVAQTGPDVINVQFPEGGRTISTGCSAPAVGSFVVKGPGVVTITVVLAPYKSLGLVSNIPVGYRVRGSGGAFGRAHPLPGWQWTKYFQNRREVKDAVDGVTLETQSRYELTEAKEYAVEVQATPQCSMMPQNVYWQEGQGVRLSVTSQGGVTVLTSVVSTSAAPTSAVPPTGVARTTAPKATLGTTSVEGGGSDLVLPTPPPGSIEPTPGLAGFTIQVGQRTVVEGGLVWVPVYLVNARDVSNMNYRITYKGSVATFEGTAQLGPFPDGALFEANAKQAGRVLVGFAKSDGASAVQAVTGYLPFRAVGKAGDRTELTVEVTRADDTVGRALRPNRIHGAVIIVGPGGVLPGDCDGDQQLTAWDARCALQISVELRAVLMALDIDKDGQVTSRDATAILQRRRDQLAGL